MKQSSQTFIKRVYGVRFPQQISDNIPENISDIIDEIIAYLPYCRAWQKAIPERVSISEGRDAPLF
ncbi:MAG: hypothetical protein DRN17_04575 [Thermoplasmata archaeon]|nr:MAG: hypothetical protein DRN17_04575 [Thermoplasmata archaeon]